MKLIVIAVLSGRYDSGIDYEVGFCYDGMAYEYDIDAVTGQLMETEFGIEGYIPPVDESTLVGADAASNAALSDAAVGKGDAENLIAEIKFHEGRFVYSVEFVLEQLEYEYIVGGISCEIITVSYDFLWF